MQPFRTAIQALAVACLLLGIVACVHEESPIARLVAERAADEYSSRLATRPQTDRTGAITALAANASRFDRNSTTPRDRIADRAPKSANGPIAVSGKDSAHFWNASQTGSPPDRGPAIQLGPLLSGGNAAHAGGSRALMTDVAADQTPLMTRTYRPISMSAVSLERLVRPLLTARGETIAATSGSPFPSDRSSSADRARANSYAEPADRPGVLIVSDRPEAIGRVDALCQDLESTSPRIAIDLVVVSVLPGAGRQLPWDQWRSSFGIVDSGLPSVLKQIRGMGPATLRASSQLQTISGTWTDLEWSAQSIAPGSSPSDPSDSADRETGTVASTPVISAPAATAITTLHVRPSSQSDGAIRVEVRAQSSRLEDHAHAERPQLVTVRFNTEVVLREGTTGVINLFVDEPFSTGSAPASPIDSAAAALVIPGGAPSIPATRIVPQPGQREQTLLLLMPRIAGPPRPPGKVAASKAHDPA